MNDLKITSTAFTYNQRIPKRYTCDGENINPPLNITGIPQEALSLVLIVEDPDAPQRNWVHWMVWNIPPQFFHMPEGSPPPSSIQGINDFGNQGYGGPCPPPGAAHRYFFKLFALDTILELPTNIKKSYLEQSMEGHILAQTDLIGIYGRDK
jgi:hypothetical protein